MSTHADPLSSSEFRTLREQATQPASTVPLAVLSATGMYSVEFLHLHDDWIDWPTNNSHAPDYPIIRIPHSNPCRRKKVKRGTSGAPVVLPRSEPCNPCKKSKTPGFTDTHRNDDNRVIPVTDSYAVDQLTYWFTQHDTIPWNECLTTLNRLSEKTINRRVSLRDLRFTFTARAVEMGFDLKVIKDRMGLSSTTPTLRRILVERRNQEDQLSHSFQDYLLLLDDHEPLSPQQIANYLDRHKRTVLKRLRNYQADGLVEKVSEGWPGSPTYWTNIAPPDATIPCSNSHCDKRFDTHSGRATHETMHCDSD